jgi:MarR family transcriptional regulator, temperature-dependent positive regulator of motility
LRNRAPTAAANDQASTLTGGQAKTSVAPVHRVPAHLARRFHQICLGVLAELTGPEELTPLEFAVLAAVGDQPGIDQRGLARRLGIDPVTTGQLVEHMEQLGLIRRRIDPADRRARQLHATPAGTKLRTRLRPAIAKAHDRIMASLSAEEQAAFLALLTRIVESNESYARPGNGRRRPRKKHV